MRIYPILVCALVLASLSQWLVEGNWLGGVQFWGSVLSLQSMQGYVVAVPAFNPPLWSLSYEVAYYLLFGLVLLERRFVWVWTALALGAAVLLYPPSVAGGIASHAISVLALSLPWLMGHFLVRWKDSLPVTSPGLGLSYLAFGLVLSRCPLSADYYDIFRLTMFALACCPLLLSLTQKPGQPEPRQSLLLKLRPAVALSSLGLLWWLSPSLFAVKLALTVLAVAAALVPPVVLEKALGSLSRLEIPLVYLGSISYALYACHAPVMLAVAGLTGSWPPVARLLVFAGITLALAHLLERKLQPFVNGLLDRNSPRHGPSRIMPG